jgi:hypothetical protein
VSSPACFISFVYLSTRRFYNAVIGSLIGADPMDGLQNPAVLEKAEPYKLASHIACKTRYNTLW